MAAGAETSVFFEVVRIVVEDDNVDCAVVIRPEPTEAPDMFIELFQDVKRQLAKPIAIWGFGLRLPDIGQIAQRFEDVDVPVYPEIEDAVRALGTSYRYSQIRGSLVECATAKPSRD
jgi:acyl-CoA synthetase (NDP forming)